MDKITIFASDQTFTEMITQERISQIIDFQADDLKNRGTGIERDDLSKLKQVDGFATIVTGLRRCGKSTLLLQKMKQYGQDFIFLNFDDIRLSDFETSDFSRLYNEIRRRNCEMVFLDEPQIVSKWEILVHQLLRERYKVFITGSNATLLSSELGTHLTGRNLPFELYPFSYDEFLRFKDLQRNPASAKEYMLSGGMPEYLKSGERQIISQLANDIIYKDIAVRNSIRDVSALRSMLVYLLSNVGNRISASKLTGMFNIKSRTTITDFFSYFESSYLLDFIPLFDYSQKVQQRNPQKVYALDTGIAEMLSNSFTDDYGRLLENLVYIQLRKKTKQIYYYNGNKECDFVAISDNDKKELVQVCLHIDDTNIERETAGLYEAMNQFNVGNGTIVTMQQSDRFEKDGMAINVVPLHEFLE